MTWVGLLVLSWIVLYVLWRFLDLTFRVLEHWHQGKRGDFAWDDFSTGAHYRFRTFDQFLEFMQARAAESAEDPTSTKGTGSSGMQQPSSSSSLH